MKTPNSISVLMGFFWIACGGWFTWLAAAVIGGSVLGAGVSLYEGSQTRKAINSAKDAAAKLQYQPIDIDALVAKAHQQAITNAKDSLALEQELQPAVAGIRSELPATVEAQLALGGKLGADERNQAASAARVIGGASGVGGGSTGLTAALTGQSADALRQQRIANAAAVLGQNQLPVTGLDPGQLASIVVADNNAKNQTEAAKVGVQTNLAQSTAANNASTAAGVGSALSSLASLALLSGAGKAPATTTTLPSISGSTFAPTFGAFNMPLTLGAGATNPGWTCWVARECFGEDDPRWIDFRAWLMVKAPRWFRHLYMRHGAAFAAWLHGHPVLKSAIRRWMVSRITA